MNNAIKERMLEIFCGDVRSIQPRHNSTHHWWDMDGQQVKNFCDFLKELGITNPRIQHGANVVEIDGNEESRDEFTRVRLTASQFDKANAAVKEIIKKEKEGYFRRNMGANTGY